MKHGLLYRFGSLILIGGCFGQSMVNASFHGTPILGLMGNSASMQSPAGLAAVPPSNAGHRDLSLADTQIAHFFGHIKDGSLRRVKELVRNNVAYVNALDELGATPLYRTVEHYCDAIVSEKKKYVNIFKHLLAQGADSKRGCGATTTEALIVWRNNRLSGDPYKGRCGELKKILDDYKSGRLVVGDNESEEDVVLDEDPSGGISLHGSAAVRTVIADTATIHHDGPTQDSVNSSIVSAADTGLIGLTDCLAHSSDIQTDAPGFRRRSSISRLFEDEGDLDDENVDTGTAIANSNNVLRVLAGLGSSGRSRTVSLRDEIADSDDENQGSSVFNSTGNQGLGSFEEANTAFDLGNGLGTDESNGVLADADPMGAALRAAPGSSAGDSGIEGDLIAADEDNGSQAGNRPLIVGAGNTELNEANSGNGGSPVTPGIANVHTSIGLTQGVQGSVQTGGQQASVLPWIQLNKALKKQNTTELERLTREHKELLTDRDPQGNTALHLALQLAQKNRAAGIQGFDFLVKKGAVYNVADASHKTVKELLPSSAVPVTLLNEASQSAGHVKPEKRTFFTRRNMALMTGIGVLSGLVLSYFLKEKTSGYGALFPRSLPGNSSGTGIDI
jgi:hypothetical protein